MTCATVERAPTPRVSAETTVHAEEQTVRRTAHAIQRFVRGGRYDREYRSHAMSDIQDDEDRTIYRVVVNHEEQYSIWPAHRDNPLGWRDAGKTGTKEECLAYVKEVWTDMRPLSLRQAMSSAENFR
jgi:MbtH protein